MFSTTLNSRSLSLFFFLGALLSMPLGAVDVPPACPSGQCPGLGQSFYPPRINLLDAKEQTGGRRILKNTAIGTCATVSKMGSSAKTNEEFTSTSELVKSWSAGFGLGKNDLNAGDAEVVVGGISLSATANTTMSRSSTASQSFKALHLYYNFLDSVVDLNQDAACWSTQNLDPAFLADFEGLPLSDPKNAGENSTWADYRVFLESWGSHVQVKQELGSLYSFWTSEDASESIDMRSLQAKACLSLGGPGFSLPLCPTFGSTEKDQAKQKKTVDKLYIAGGDVTTRNALLQLTQDPVEGQKRLNDFISKASSSDQAVGYKYAPIWNLLMTVYRQQCGQDGVGSKSCGNFQRAVNLQAAYEGFLAFQCVKSVVNSGEFLVQGMIAEVPNGNGIYYYACHQAKTGCHSDNDCNNYTVKGSTGVTGWVPSEESFCGGGSCLDAKLIEGTSQYRSVIKELESPLLKENADVGVNASCRNDKTATCDLSWGGGKPERLIWVQSTGGGGSGTFTTGHLESRVNGFSDPATVSETGTVTVEIADHTALNEREVKTQQNERIKESQTPDENRVFVKGTDTQGEAKILCGGVCKGIFAKGETVRLEASLKVGQRRFYRWSDNRCSNGLSGKGRICEIKVNGDVTVQAYYR